jgi:enoyl-CoA hydratase/carnithine racemase
MNLFDRIPSPENAPQPGACVRVERPEPGLALVVLDPPHRSLAVLDGPLLRDLDAVLDGLAREGDLRGVVVTGRTPTSFAAGADVEVIQGIEEAELATELARFGQALFGKLAALRARTVAAVGGPVPGGAFELALACDLIVLAEHPSTRIGLPETRLGILPGWGGCQRLPRRVGVAKAKEMMFASLTHSGEQAAAMGLVNICVPDAQFDQEVERIARAILANSLFSNRANKSLVDQTDGMHIGDGLRFELMESRGIAPDAAERLAGFSRKEKDRSR